MTHIREKAWTWGYVIPKSVEGPGDVPYVGVATQTGKSWCSLETAASYLGTPNVIFKNSMHDKNTLTDEYIEPIASSDKIICSLPFTALAETAKRVSALSLKHTNITGAIIDDFLEFHSAQKTIPPDTTRAVYEALRSENQSLRLYVVRYTWQDHTELLPHLPYFDVINLWVWVANLYDWQVKMNEFEIDKLKRLTGKPVVLGLFVHDYGRTDGPVPMDILELQFKTAVRLTDSGVIEGFFVLQSGWFDKEDHRLQAQWIKQYFDWLFNTRR